MYDFIEDLKNKTYEKFMEQLTIKNTIKSPIPSLTIELLADGYAEIEKQEYRVDEVLMNARTYTDIRKFNRDVLDLETKTENLLRGIMAYLWGACIVVSKKIPDNIILILPEPKFKIVAILKINEGEGYSLVKELMRQTTELKKLISDATKKANEIDKIIYEITKTEE